MADITQITSYTGRYSGLLNNFYVTIAIAGVCLIGYEIEVHIPRRRGRDGTFKRIHVRIGLAAKRAWSRWTKGRIKQKQRGNHIDLKALVGENGGAAQVSAEERARRRLGSRESWEFGYMHQPKAWRLDPSPPVSRWPLAWVVSSLKVRERDMPETCGLDLTLHARFLRGCFFYSCLQAIIVLPILMPLHIFYSPDNISSTSMTRASVSSLVQSSGQRWLWVHAVLVWWMTLTWLATALWIIWGGLAYRKREVRRLAERTRQSREKLREQQGGEVGAGPAGQSEAWSVGDECEGIKRFRTVMITNVPPDMRDEATLRDYFDHYIHRHRVRSGHVTQQINAPNAPPEGKEDTALQRIAFSPKRLLRTKAAKANNIEDREEEIVKSVGQSTMEECDDFESEVDEVILVRKLGRLVNLRDRRNAVLRQLEVAHVKLAQRVLEAVAKYKEKHPDKDGARIVIHPVHDLEKGVLGFNASRDEALPPHLSKEERMDRLVSALGTFVGDEPDQLGKGEETVWDVLHALPRELLDPYQSLTHLTSLFRDQNAPLIDYLSTKLSYLTLLLDEARSRPLSSFDASSTAFVTFRDARTCRLALKILDSHPKRSLACHTTPAPDWTNLLWARLGKSVYRSEFVRGWAVYFGVWAFTLVWIFPVSFLCALSSLDNLAAFLPALADYLQRNPNTARFVTSLVPVILVAGLTIAICPILLLIANRAETIVTRLGIHNSVLERFWKFLMVNGVVFFAIGQAAIQSYLNAFRNRNFDPLPVVASAFPSAAPYFASYVLLQTAIQPCFELFRFGLAHIVYVFGTRVSTIPRQRNSRTEYPTFSHFSQLPYQLLAGAIMHLFMILNPLVIPFCLIYYATCYLVWKRQFTYVYGRLYENNGRRSSVRILRYSLDAVALAQFVLFAFFILNKAKGHAISTGILFFLTLFAKLIITRAIKRRHDNLDIEESDILCPPALREQDSTNAGQGEDTLDDWVSVDYPNHSRAGSTKSGRFSTFKHDISTWVGKWGYASHGTPAGHRKPIPFEHVLFATLDSKISFDDDKQSTVPPLRATIPDTDAEMVHKPDHPIIHEPAPKIVVPHHAIRAWEDIPPYQRSRGYHDQPAYTDDYDDFLWLPRDPLSTLDLDDTVEMRLALTTSAGGAGTIGDWPPIDFVDHPEEEVAVQEEAWQEVMIKRRSHSPETPDRPSRTMSPSSEKRLIEPIELSPFIGSEVDHGPGSGLIRRGTRRVGEGLTSLFRRPRSDTHHTDDSDFGISMRTLSSSSASREDRASLPSAFTTRAEGLGIATSDGDILARPPMTAPLVGSSRISITRPKATHGGSFSSARLTSSSDSGSPFLLPVRTSTPRLMQTEELVGNDQIERLDLASPASTVVIGEPGAASPPVDASTLQRERSSQLTIQLGRSPSGRRPMGLPASVRLRSGSRTSTTLSFAEDPHPPRSPRLAVDPKSPTRSATSIMARSRSMRAGRDRSFSLLNAQQQALMSEVMKEEQIAAAEDRKEERVERMKDEEALMRERGQGLSSASTRRLSTRTKADSDGASDVGSGPPTLSRGVSKMSTASRGLSIRGKFERSGSSNTTATIQTTATGSGPAPPPTVQVEGPIEDLTPKALATLPNTDV